MVTPEQPARTKEAATEFPSPLAPPVTNAIPRRNVDLATGMTADVLSEFLKMAYCRREAAVNLYSAALLSTKVGSAWK